MNWPPLRVSKLMFQALALHQRKWRNFVLCVCLTYRLTHWLANLCYPLTGFSIGIPNWQTDCEVCTLSNQVTNWQLDWLRVPASSWLSDEMGDWLTDWQLADWPSGWLIDWQASWLPNWRTDRLNGCNSLWRRVNARNVSFETLHGGQCADNQLSW